MNIDKDTCQSMYDDGMSLNEIALHFRTYGLKIKRLGITTRSSSESKKLRNTQTHSQETKDKLSKIAQDRGFGGRNYRKTFHYNGVVLESSYELQIAQELDCNGVKWERPKRFYWTDASGRKRHYTPDFYLPEYDVYLDPKNDYLIKIDVDKIHRTSVQNNIRVLVLNKHELTWSSIAELV